MRSAIERLRLLVVFVVIGALFGVIEWRLIDISWHRHAWYSQTAAAQATGAANILLRGNIYLSDRGHDDVLVATNHRFPMLAIVSAKVPTERVASLTDSIARITNLDPADITKALTASASGSRVLMHRLTDSQVSEITALHAPGISVGYEADRTYPAGSLAANVIGFYGYSSQGRSGQYGIESAYEDELSGVANAAPTYAFGSLGWLKSLVGGIPSTDVTANRPEDVELTLDKNIQSYIEGALADTIKKYRAASGVVIVQEPHTGKIMGMASSPSFDPNFYSSYPQESFLNSALLPFEPGSSFKPVIMAIGLDTKTITPSTTFNDVGDVVIDGYTIKNFNEGHFGNVTMAQVLEKSINTGVMYVQSLLTHDQFLHGIVDMGFGQKTNIDLPGEAPGSIGNLYTGRRINFMTASFGQGITVTPLQLVNAYSAIANNGNVMRPYVVAALRDERGNRIETKPEIVSTPFSVNTARQLTGMLVSVVDKGFDKARIPRYDVAGKTGTAQIASPDGGYLEDQYNHSFVGFAPASDPQFTVLIKIERPQGITFAADSLSPVFKAISLFLINYLNIPPTR